VAVPATAALMSPLEDGRFAPVLNGISINFQETYATNSDTPKITSLLMGSDSPLIKKA
jgi:hypothetical protein